MLVDYFLSVNVLSYGKHCCVFVLFYLLDICFQHRLCYSFVEVISFVVLQQVYLFCIQFVKVLLRLF